MMSNRHSHVLWADCKHYFGLPIHFESYQMSGDRLFLTTGLWSQNQRQIKLYTIEDLRVKCSFFQRCCGVGTVIVTTIHNHVITLENIRSPFQVKELLHECIEEEKEKKWYRHYSRLPYGYS